VYQDCTSCVVPAYGQEINL